MSARVIRQLPESVINQIAAGEVIERPASIVKELLENALDAGAGCIDIALEDGGIGRIEVRDDGGGIPPAQLPLALTRHCTSKITSADDLPVLVTLGFRGEALAAIAAVAATSVTSRTAEAAHGWRIAQQPGRAPGPVEPAAHPPGTTVVARDLFAQVPARRRFLKRAQTEFLHVLNLVRRVAFCAPGVAFSLTHDGSRSLQLPAAADPRAAERRQRGLFGAEFAQGAQWVDVVADGIRVFGWVGGPALAHAQADLQMLAVNGRVIRDRHLSHAVRIAYEDSLPQGRFPSFALHLEMAPDAVDVNVHPGKIEVRFRELRTVHDVLHAAVRQALAPPALPLPTTIAPAPRALPPQARDGFATPPAYGRLRPSVTRPRPVAASSPAGSATGPTAVLALVAGRYALLAGEPVPGLVDLARLVEQLCLWRLDRPWSARPLTIPLRVECADEFASRALAAELETCGLECSALGERTFALRSLPPDLPAFDPLRFGAALAGGGSGALASRLATAVAAALEPPATGELSDWLSRLLAEAARAGIAPGAYRRTLDAETLDRNFLAGDAP